MEDGGLGPVSGVVAQAGLDAGDDGLHLGRDLSLGGYIAGIDGALVESLGHAVSAPGAVVVAQADLDAGDELVHRIVAFNEVDKFSCYT